MRNRKRFVCRIIAALVLVCMLLPTGVCAAAQDQTTPFQVYVRAGKQGLYVGQFLLRSGNLYVSENTLLQMGDIQSDSDQNRGCRLQRDTASVKFSDKKTVEHESERYFPFAETLSRLGIHAAFSAEERTLRVAEGKLPEELDAAMLRIYNNQSYNMFSWQNSKTYLPTRAGTMLADCIKNFSYVQYATQAQVEEDYRSAFWKILLPENNEDLQFIENLAKDAKSVSGSYKMGETFIRFIGDLTGNELLSQANPYLWMDDSEVVADLCVKSYAEAINAMNLDGVKELLVFSDLLDRTTESMVRGLDLAINFAPGGKNTMVVAGNRVLSSYNGEEAAAGQIVTEILKGLMMDKANDAATNAVWQPIKDGFSGTTGKISWGIAFAKAVNQVIDRVWGVQEDVNAALDMMYLLDIQKQCGSYYKMRRSHYLNGPWENRGISIQNMHDVMMVYLAAAEEAWRTAADDPKMEAAASSVLQQIERDKQRLAGYQKEDFEIVERLQKAQAALTDYENGLTTEEDRAVTPLEGVASITVELEEGTRAYSLLTGERELCFLDFYLEGATDDGNALHCSDDGIVYASDGTPMARQIQGENEYTIHFYDLNAFYSLTIANDFPGANDWMSYTNFTVDIPGVEDFDREEFEYRGTTQISFYSIVLDHGVLTPGYWLWP